MAWSAYKICLQLLSPVHIGWRKLGNLQQTRRYVPGRSLWGALTARLTREAGGENYEEVGKKVDNLLTFTYFYPSTSPETVEIWPWPDERDLFSWTFMNSYVSTSLINGRNAADGSLHEIEYITPFTRDGLKVYLVGYVFERVAASFLPGWQQAMNMLQLGGERGYGWGRVRLVQASLVNDRICFGYRLDCSGEYPLLTSSTESYLLAHTSADNTQRGAIELLVGRETSKKTGFGQQFSVPQLCWPPGEKVVPDEIFQICEKGIWQRYTTI